MTEYQLKQWNDKACGSRAVIKHSQVVGMPITPDELIRRFSVRYHHWNQQCGIAGLCEILDMGRALGLFRGAEVFQHMGKVREILSSGGCRGIYLLTNKTEDENGGFCDLFHVNFIVGASPTHWRVWTSFQCGGETDDIHWSDQDIRDRLGAFLVTF